MNLQESNDLVNTLKTECFRVYGTLSGISRLAGLLLAHCSYLLADDRHEEIKEIIASNIQKEIENLKTLPDENLQ